MLLSITGNLHTFKTCRWCSGYVLPLQQERNHIWRDVSCFLVVFLSHHLLLFWTEDYKNTNQRPSAGEYGLINMYFKLITLKFIFYHSASLVHRIECDPRFYSKFFSSSWSYICNFVKNRFEHSCIAYGPASVNGYEIMTMRGV